MSRRPAGDASTCSGSAIGGSASSATSSTTRSGSPRAGTGSPAIERALARGRPRARPEDVAPGRPQPVRGARARGPMLRVDDRPTAIFAASDTQALGVLAAAQDSGLHVPDDLSVIGYDDIEACRLRRPDDRSPAPVRVGPAGRAAAAWPRSRNAPDAASGRGHPARHRPTTHDGAPEGGPPQAVTDRTLAIAADRTSRWRRTQMFSTNPDGSLTRRRIVRGPGILVAALAILRRAPARRGASRRTVSRRPRRRRPRPRRRPPAQAPARRPGGCGRPTAAPTRSC